MLEAILSVLAYLAGTAFFGFFTYFLLDSGNKMSKVGEEGLALLTYAFAGFSAAGTLAMAIAGIIDLVRACV